MKIVMRHKTTGNRSEVRIFGFALVQTCSRSESLNPASAMTDAYSALDRIFHGASDDWTVVGPCKGYVERLRTAGKDAALIEYADAHHSFDNPGIALRKFPSVFSTRSCTFVEESGRIVEAETRGSIFYSACWSRGASVGYNADAHPKSREGRGNDSRRAI